MELSYGRTPRRLADAYGARTRLRGLAAQAGGQEGGHRLTGQGPDARLPPRPAFRRAVVAPGRGPAGLHSPAPSQPRPARDSGPARPRHARGAPSGRPAPAAADRQPVQRQLPPPHHRALRAAPRRRGPHPRPGRRPGTRPPRQGAATDGGALRRRPGPLRAQDRAGTAPAPRLGRHGLRRLVHGRRGLPHARRSRHDPRGRTAAQLRGPQLLAAHHRLLAYRRSRLRRRPRSAIWSRPRCRGCRATAPPACM